MPSAAIPAGKLPADLLSRLLGRLGPMPPEVLLGPRVGEDACALDLPAGILVVATDPITLTGREVGRLAVIVNANDVAVTGAQPRWFLATVLLPEGTSAAEVDDLFATMHQAVTAVGATLVGGHTEITAAVNQPVVVGQMIGLVESAASGRVVATGGARPGDVVVQVGPAPVEAGAVLAAEAGAGTTAEAGTTAVPHEVVQAAAAGLDDPGISVVDAALAAAELGATALHDPTEGGLAGGLHELADAAGAALRIDRARVLWFDPAVAVCRALGVDPWAALASGSLLACFPPADAEAAVAELTRQGHESAVIGHVEPGQGVHDTEDHPIPLPTRDEVARHLSLHDEPR